MGSPNLSLPGITLQKYPDLRAEAAYFGFEIPYLPDFLADHTLLGQTPREKLKEVLDRFERFIIGLRKLRGSAFVLRFISDPQQGTVELYLLGRVWAAAGYAEAQAIQAAHDLDVHLIGYRIPHRPLKDLPDDAGKTLSQVQCPFPHGSPLVEIRQHEELTRLAVIQQDAYVIHPYWQAEGACLQPLEAMLQQTAPTVLSIYLEPIDISDAEVAAIDEAAHIAQTLADVNIAVQSTTSISRRRDPAAERLSKIYSAYRQTLNEPFLVTAQVVSPDASAAWTVARVFAAEAIQGGASSANDPASANLPSQADCLAPSNADEYAAAWNCFQNLLMSGWGTSRATPGKERFPYLAGARGASAVFRLPVNLGGGIPGLAVRQLPPDFEPGPRHEQPGPKEIILGRFENGGTATIPVSALTRHTLITGFTGSGKTNTVLYLLDQLWRQQRIPFLVIESAKKEYRSLLKVPGFESLLVFTLGDETVSPFRLNPFELLPGVRVEAHIGRLQACFDAALPQFGILPSIVAEALERVYRNKGWNLTDKAPAQTDVETANRRLFPTLRDLYTEVIRVTDERGYAGETLHNIRAAAAGRIGNLLRGSRGRMLGGQRSIPSELLFSRPVVLELNDLNEEDKSLIMMFLLTWLREWRELHPGRALQHVTVVEEAHNVVGNVQSVGASEIAADTRAKAVSAFANMLSEVRAYGEGIVISDQSPEKLAPDAMRNTNLQIAHQLRDRRDREAIARAMIMDEEQQDYLARLGVGEAALFRTGIQKATFIRVPEYKDEAGFDEPPADAEVEKQMAVFRKQYITAVLPFDGCRFCGSPCRHREAIEPHTLDKELHEQLQAALKRFDEQPDTVYWPAHWRRIAEVCAEAARRAGLEAEKDAAYCYFAHEIDFAFTRSMRESFEKATLG
ncbi:MAG TPA: DUF87 domain-containing protein [Anaerolineaceae bacterium]|nr:DUF87 domain-containing protein [Anaerolineaceae bacterium]